MKHEFIVSEKNADRTFNLKENLSWVGGPNVTKLMRISGAQITSLNKNVLKLTDTQFCRIVLVFHSFIVILSVTQWRQQTLVQ